MPNITITEQHQKQRLDQMLQSVLLISRTQIQKLITTGEITVNGKTCTPHLFLKIGDVVVYPNLTKPKKIKKDVAPLEILFEDEDVLVINKPAGLLVHPTTKDEKRPSVVDAVLAHAPSVKKVGDNPLRPGIVHRLDKDVSGVMVIAKTNAAFEDLKQQFQNRTVEKMYTALVYGKLSKPHDVIDLKISRSKRLGRMVARTGDQEGKEAVTEYDVVDQFKNATLVQVRIHTGRTHQIRVHFFAIDHSVVGDRLYKKRVMRHVRHMELGRLFLHATSLSFTLLDGTKKTITSPIPDDLKTILLSLPRK